MIKKQQIINTYQKYGKEIITYKEDNRYYLNVDDVKMILSEIDYNKIENNIERFYDYLLDIEPNATLSRLFNLDLKGLEELAKECEDSKQLINTLI